MDELENIMKELENDEDSTKNFHNKHGQNAHRFRFVTMATLGVGALGGLAVVSVSPVIAVVITGAAMLSAAASALAENVLRDDMRKG